MFSFLSAPALSESETAQTAAAETQGFKAGETERADRAQQAADLAKETQREEAASNLETAKANAASLAKHVENLKAANKEIYDSRLADLNTKITAQEAALNTENNDTQSPAYQHTVADHAQNVATRNALVAGRERFLAGNPEGKAETFPETANAPGAPPPGAIPLNAVGKALHEADVAEKLAKSDKAVSEAVAAEHKNSNAPPPKVPTHAAASADAFSGSQSLLVPQAQRVAALEKTSLANPGDAIAERALNEARGALQKTRDAAQSNYSKTVNSIASGDYGDDVKAAYVGIASALPAGTDPAQIENHGKIRAVLAQKQSSGSLTPGEVRLGKILRTDQDVSGAWGTSGLPSNKLGSPSAVRTAIQNEGVPLQPVPNSQSSPATSTAPLLPPPDNSALTGGSSF